jgi:hypothetical protein
VEFLLVENERAGMANEGLATYLNDHLAGSVVALELLAHLEGAYDGSPDEQSIAALRAEIEADRQVLEDLMARLGIAESRPRQATAWLAGKVSELKLLVDDPGQGALRRLEGLEAVSLGIEGKVLLWQTLGALAEEIPGLGQRDYTDLTRAARDQRARVEKLREQAAREALGAAT